MIRKRVRNCSKGEYEFLLSSAQDGCAREVEYEISKDRIVSYRPWIVSKKSMCTMKQASLQSTKHLNIFKKQREHHEVYRKLMAPSVLKAVLKGETQPEKNFRNMRLSKQQKKKKYEQALRLLTEIVEHYDLLSHLVQAKELPSDMFYVAMQENRRWLHVVCSRRQTTKQFLSAFDVGNTWWTYGSTEDGKNDQKRLKLLNLRDFEAPAKKILVWSYFNYTYSRSISLPALRSLSDN